MLVLAAKEKCRVNSQYCFIHHLCCVMDHQWNLWLENCLLSLRCFYATLNRKFKKSLPSLLAATACKCSLHLQANRPGTLLLLSAVSKQSVIVTNYLQMHFTCFDLLISVWLVSLWEDKAMLNWYLFLWLSNATLGVDWWTCSMCPAAKSVCSYKLFLQEWLSTSLTSPWGRKASFTELGSDRNSVSLH